MKRPPHTAASGLFALALVVGVSPPARSQPVPAQPLPAPSATPRSFELAAVQGAIDAANRAYVDALVKKDPQAFGSLFTVDAVSLPTHSPMVHGREAIVASMRDVFEHLTFESGKIRTLETHLDGDTASEIGFYEFDVVVDGNAQTLRGRYLVVWREENGVWKIAIDASQPGAPAT